MVCTELDRAEKNHDAGYPQPRRRLAEYLLLRDHSCVGPEINMRLEDIANSVGLRPETVSRRGAVCPRRPCQARGPRQAARARSRRTRRGRAPRGLASSRTRICPGTCESHLTPRIHLEARFPFRHRTIPVASPKSTRQNPLSTCEHCSCEHFSNISPRLLSNALKFPDFFSLLDSNQGTPLRDTVHCTCTDACFARVQKRNPLRHRRDERSDDAGTCSFHGIIWLGRRPRRALYHFLRAAYALQLLPQPRHLGGRRRRDDGCRRASRSTERYRSYWGPEGGITVSGGAKLCFKPSSCSSFHQSKSPRHQHLPRHLVFSPFTRNEPYFGTFTKLMDVCDLVMADIKHIDPEEHKKLTGRDNANILDCLRSWPRSVSRSGFATCSFPASPMSTSTCIAHATLSPSWAIASNASRFCPTTRWASSEWDELNIPYKLQ